MSRRVYGCPEPAGLPTSYARWINDVAAGRIRGTAVHPILQPSGRTRLEYTDPGAYVKTFDVSEYGGDIQAALTDALASRGHLHFPAGVYTTSAPIVITGRVRVSGAGHDSQLRYTGAGAAVRVELDVAEDPEGVEISGIRITGSSETGQHGIEGGYVGAAPRTAHIHHVEIDGMLGGFGVSLKTPINCVVEACKIQGALDGIVLRSPCGCRVDANWLNYWANNAIRCVGASGDGLAAMNNSISRNIIHGDPEQVQDAAQDRAGIRVDGCTAVTIANNYLEDIDAPPGGAGVAHGIWLRKTTASLTQGCRIYENRFGPNLVGGDAIRIDSGVSHSTVGPNLVGSYTIADSGSYTSFAMQNLASLASLVGTSTTRLGRVYTTSGGDIAVPQAT